MYRALPGADIWPDYPHRDRLKSRDSWALSPEGATLKKTTRPVVVKLPVTSDNREGTSHDHTR